MTANSVISLLFLLVCLVARLLAISFILAEIHLVKCCTETLVKVQPTNIASGTHVVYYVLHWIINVMSDNESIFISC